jgi:hypothetical protein
MTTQKILFEPEITLPASDKFLFDVCNNASNHWELKQDFYKLKAEMLQKYATKAGIAKQKIKKECNSCDGTGFYQRGVSCMRCSNGIYEVRTYYLQRWVMNGDLYFVPVTYNPENMGGIVQEFEGYVSDWVEPVKGVNPFFAYAALTSKHNKFMFQDFLHLFKNSLSKSDWKKWGEICKGKANFIESLATWYGMELQKDTVDDLPF